MLFRSGLMTVTAGATAISDANDLKVLLTTGETKLSTGSALLVSGVITGNLDLDISGSVTNFGILSVSKTARVRVSNQGDVSLVGSNAINYLDIASSGKVLISGATSGGVIISGASSIEIKGSKVLSAPGNAITVVSAGSVVISGNTVSNSGKIGIIVSNSTAADVRDNTINISGADGISLESVSAPLVRRNIVTGVVGYGIRLTALSGASVADNTIIQDASGSVSAGASLFFSSGRTAASAGGTIRRGLVRFDLSSIPAGARGDCRPASSPRSSRAASGRVSRLPPICACSPAWPPRSITSATRGAARSRIRSPARRCACAAPRCRCNGRRGRG